jgi:acetyl-CoA carboxylase biotin carboxylase subunit
MFRSVLIANRAEIAIRVIRACRRLGVRTVAVYSDADKDALHVRMADEAHYLGAAEPSRSYLDQDKILEAAIQSGVDAVHPGYGFLSENATFARRLESAGITFIGPSPEAMQRLGDKVSARKIAIENNVPVAQGSEGTVQDAAHARSIAKEVGYPVLLKAAAGGGGIGMRVVREESEMDAAFQGAQETAASAFGVPDLFLEKYLERPRHIEVQVLGDKNGHLIHLGERECSIQRRHQKLVEEAPSPALDEDQRRRVGEMAVRMAKAGGYHNAGTMEFLLAGGEFHFNEMNTRLQVEHPVTEMITGVDLAAWQIKIAAGQPLTLQQDDITFTGHAIELRINAEDPAKEFAPSPGRVRRWVPPAGPGVRVDHGVRSGWTIPSQYDSMIAKLIVWGSDRAEALERAEAALAETHLEGFPTNIPLHKAILKDETMRAGDLTTRFLEERRLLESAAGTSDHQRAHLERIAAIVAALDTPRGGGLRILHERQHAVRTAPTEPTQEVAP